MSKVLNEIKGDLRAFSILLGNWGKNVKNPELINNIGNLINDSINYSLEKSSPLIFQNIDIERHVIPKGIEDEKGFEVELTIILQQTNTSDDSKDLIESLGVAIKIEGLYDTATGCEEAVCSWHLDKGNGVSALYNHPLYHMNFGGHLMIDKLSQENNQNYFGNLLLLPSPRVMHPPMDIVLACDFIIKNFYKTTNHISITTLPTYTNIIEKARNRYVKPYILALLSEWDDNCQINNLSHSAILGH